jgi:hypothetical protein
MEEEGMSDERGPATPGEDQIRAVLERARGGDADSLPAARLALDADPAIWRDYGDLAAHARRSWIALIAGPDLVLMESLGRKLAEMEAELAGPAASPLEVLLVGRIGISWLESSYADAAAARAGEGSVKQADFLRRRQDSAHRRHLTAIAALATVRRLLGLADKSSGRGSPSIVPGNDDRGDRVGLGLDNQDVSPVQGDLGERGLVLAFGPHEPGAAKVEKSRRPGKSKVSSRS